MNQIIHNVNPASNFSKEQFLEYSKKACKITMETLNINTCNKERKVDNPYVSFKLTKPHDIYGENAEFRVLKFWNSPKALKELTQSNTSRIMTAVKSDATHGSWEYGDMYFADMCVLIMDGYVKEIQRDVDYSLYEWRMSIYHMALKDDRKEINVLKEYREDVREALEAITESKMSWEETKEAMSNREVDEVFSYSTDNKIINSSLRFLSQSFNHSQPIEVETLLKFLNNVIMRYKSKHMAFLKANNKDITAKSLSDMANPMDMILSVETELENLKDQVKVIGDDIAEA
jgi:hypothetical protein